MPQPGAAHTPAIPGGGRPEANGERLDRALRGLLARRSVRRVLPAVKIFCQVDIPEPLALVVLRDAACDIARRLHGEPA